MHISDLIMGGAGKLIFSLHTKSHKISKVLSQCNVPKREGKSVLFFKVKMMNHLPFPTWRHQHGVLKMQCSEGG